MANKTAVLVKLCKVDGTWRRYPVVISKNGKPKPGWVRIHGRDSHNPDGDYLIRFYEGKKTVYKNVGPHAGDAYAALQKHQKVRTAKELVRDTGAAIQEPQGRTNLRNALNRFITATKDRGSKEAAILYENAVEEFLQATGKTYADEITTDDISRFHRALRKRGMSDRTIFNRHSNVVAFFKFLKLPTKELAPKKPKYEKTVPETYSHEELKTFFASLKDQHHKMIFEMLLKCGLREQEAMYLEWPNVDLANGILYVKGNPRFDFKVKDSEQRAIPIPSDLLAMMKKWHKTNPKRLLVTGTTSDKPNKKLLRTLKRAVKNAGLNCGHCYSCKAYGECERWFLHKFRATCITTLLRSGMDLRTVMKFSGHSDMESVMRYLSPASDEAIRNHIDTVQWV